MFLKRSSQGFTLIEVMIALLIISLALTAIMQSLSQYTRTLIQVQHKITAIMISKQLLNEMRVGLLAPPSDRTRTISHTVFLNHRWYWYMQVHNTPNQHIQKISLSLFETQPTPHQTPLFTTAGYRYV